MQNALLCDSKSVLGMKIENEFVMVSLASGKFFHFNAESESFFSFFRSPRSLSEFAESHALNGQEMEYLQNLCAFLVNEKVLTPSVDQSCGREATAPSYQRPTLLREGEKRLSEVEFSYP